MRVRGRTAIVTGSGSGIGEGIVKMLSQEGASVCVTDVSGEDVNRVVDMIRTHGGVAIGVQADVSQADDVATLCQHVLAEFGRIDILVNNASITAEEIAVNEMSEEAWDRVVNANLKSQFLCCCAVAGIMKKQQHGRIVNIASRNWLGRPGLANDAASKGGIVSLTRTLAMELGRHGITVNCVSPAPGADIGSPKQLRALAERVKALPIPRLATPADIAYAVLCFAADEAGYITGQHFYVGGGDHLATSGTL